MKQTVLLPHYENDNALDIDDLTAAFDDFIDTCIPPEFQIIVDFMEFQRKIIERLLDMISPILDSISDLEDIVWDMLLAGAQEVLSMCEALSTIFDYLGLDTEETTFYGVLSDFLDPLFELIETFTGIDFPDNLVEDVLSVFDGLDFVTMWESWFEENPTRSSGQEIVTHPDQSVYGKSVPDEDFPVAFHISYTPPFVAETYGYSTEPITRYGLSARAYVNFAPTLDFIISLKGLDVYAAFPMPVEMGGSLGVDFEETVKKNFGAISFGVVFGHRDYSGLFMSGGPVFVSTGENLVLELASKFLYPGPQLSFYALLFTCSV